MPGFLYGGSIHVPRQVAVVDAPEQAIAEESCAGGLEAWSMFCVHHRPCPVSLRLLQFLDSLSQPDELLCEERLVAIVLRHVLQHFGKACQHPSVAASPEILLPADGSVLGVDILPIAEIEASRIVEHDAVAEAKVLVELVQILCVACQPVHLRHHRHHHIQGIGPPPVVVGFRVGLVAHHFFGARHFLLRLLACFVQIVEVDVGLEADLPVAEEHIILSFAVLPVFPFLRIGFCGTLPMVVFSPTDAVFQHLPVLQQVIHFHIACMVGRMVPEGSDLSRIVGLPVGVCLSDDVFHFIGSPLFCLCAHSRQDCHQNQ